MPPQGVPLLHHSAILSYDQITDFAKLAVSKGISKIRVTGGEPLVRKEIEKLITKLALIDGIADLSLTTNGQLLNQKAAHLKAAGLQRINISLDSLDPEQYRLITRGGEVGNVLEGIKAAQRVGLSPIKINCVVHIEHHDTQKEVMQQFAQREGLELRFIHQMSLHQGHFSVVEGGSGGDCARCNRLRLTANGMLKPCLFSDLEYNIRSMGYAEALEATLIHKPPKGTQSHYGSFYRIGG
jgi:cyclic pyranopterin phosphate synthase